jgi:hypothetical protein
MIASDIFCLSGTKKNRLKGGRLVLRGLCVRR